MLRGGVTAFLIVSKQIRPTVCCKQITRVLSSHGDQTTFSLDNASTAHSADGATITYQIVHPGKVSPGCFVPSHIERPSYAVDSKLSRIVHNSWISDKLGIEIKSEKQIMGMRDACRIARDVLNTAGEAVRCGRTTDEIDIIAHNACIAAGAYPSPLLYRGFPKSVCTSVNNVACHGIPDDRPLSSGDLINIDVTVYFRGFHGDVSETFLVGDVDSIGQQLVNIAKCCRDRGIAVCGPGQPFNAIGEMIRQTAESNGYQVIPVFCGHGIGSYFHGPPDIIHVDNDIDSVMQEGMTFTVEPVITEGEPDIRVLDDGWTAVSLDNSRSAQFEHTLLVTQHGVEILTL